MLKLRKLIKEHTWDREFGDPLVTFEDVMKKHQVNKLQEDWWDNMSPEDQAEYIKAHPTSQKAQASKEEPKEKPSDRYADVDTSWMDDPDAAAAQGSPGYTTSDDDNWGREKGYGQKGHKSYDSSDIRKKKDVKGREYDPKTGKGKGQDSRNEPDDEEYFKSMMSRTGKELNQETITVDGKQFRRINESVEKQPKPKYEFSEFYERFKR